MNYANFMFYCAALHKNFPYDFRYTDSAMSNVMILIKLTSFRDRDN